MGSRVKRVLVVVLLVVQILEAMYVVELHSQVLYSSSLSATAPYIRSTHTQDTQIFRNNVQLAVRFERQSPESGVIFQIVIPPSQRLAVSPSRQYVSPPSRPSCHAEKSRFEGDRQVDARII